MNTLKKRKSGKKGFTLMEMLIVVAIIGILIAIDCNPDLQQRSDQGSHFC